MVLQPLPLASPRIIPDHRVLAARCHAGICTSNTLCSHFLVNCHLCMPCLAQTTKRSSIQRLGCITCLLRPPPPHILPSDKRILVCSVLLLESVLLQLLADPISRGNVVGIVVDPQGALKCGDHGEALGYDEVCSLLLTPRA